MKPLTDVTHSVRCNLFGIEQDVFTQQFEVEDSDVGTKWYHLNGYKCGQSHTFRRADIGKVIETLSYGSAFPTHSWYWSTTK
jgi:hypothetical protein